MSHILSALCLLLTIFGCAFILILPSSSSAPVEKRQFLFPSFALKSEVKKEKHSMVPAVEAPMNSKGGDDAEAPFLDVPANVFPIRRVPGQKEFAMRPCYFSPIQCLLHTPDHDRMFANYPEFQHQNSPYARAAKLRAGGGEESAAVNNFKISSPRVKNAVEALLVQSQLERKAARRMQRQSSTSPLADLLESAEAGTAAANQQLSRHRLFGNPWRRGL